MREENDVLQASSLTGSSRAGICSRLRLEANKDLRQLVRKGGHGFRNQLGIYNLEGTYIPKLVFGVELAVSMRTGMRRVSELVDAHLDALAESAQEVYNKGLADNGLETTRPLTALHNCMRRKFQAEVLSVVDTSKCSLVAWLSAFHVEKAYEVMGARCQQLRCKKQSIADMFEELVDMSPQMALDVEEYLVKDICTEVRSCVHIMGIEIRLAHSSASAISKTLLNNALPISDLVDNPVLHACMESQQKLVDLAAQLQQDPFCWLPRSSIETKNPLEKQALCAIEKALDDRQGAYELFSFLSSSAEEKRKSDKKDELARQASASSPPTPRPAALPLPAVPEHQRYQCQTCPANQDDNPNFTRGLIGRLKHMCFPAGYTLCRPCGDWLSLRVGEILDNNSGKDDRDAKYEIAIADRRKFLPRKNNVLRARTTRQPAPHVDEPKRQKK